MFLHGLGCGMKRPCRRCPRNREINEFQRHGALLLKGAEPSRASRSSETMVISIQLGPWEKLGHFIYVNPARPNRTSPADQYAILT